MSTMNVLSQTGKSVTYNNDRPFGAAKKSANNYQSYMD